MAPTKLGLPKRVRKPRKRGTKRASIPPKNLKFRDFTFLDEDDILRPSFDSEKALWASKLTRAEYLDDVMHSPLGVFRPQAQITQFMDLLKTVKGNFDELSQQFVSEALSRRFALRRKMTASKSSEKELRDAIVKIMREVNHEAANSRRFDSKECEYGAKHLLRNFPSAKFFGRGDLGVRSAVNGEFIAGVELKCAPKTTFKSTQLLRNQAMSFFVGADLQFMIIANSACFGLLWKERAAHGSFDMFMYPAQGYRSINTDDGISEFVTIIAELCRISARPKAEAYDTRRVRIDSSEGRIARSGLNEDWLASVQTGGVKKLGFFDPYLYKH